MKVLVDTPTRSSKMILDRITSDPTRMNGQPCVRDLRLTVRRVVELAALYPDRAELCREYPELEEEDIRQAIAWKFDNESHFARGVPCANA